MSATRRIRCGSCKHEGVVEAHDTQESPPDRVFKLLGKDESGYLHVRCPACDADLAASPIAWLARGSMGLPVVAKPVGLNDPELSALVAQDVERETFVGAMERDRQRVRRNQVIGCAVLLIGGGWLLYAVIGTLMEALR